MRSSVRPASSRSAVAVERLASAVTIARWLRHAVAGLMVLLGVRAIAGESAILLLGDSAYPPLTYLEQGEPRGMVVELVQALEKQLGRSIRIELMDWQVAQEKTLRGEADGVIQMTVSEDRAKVYDFATPFFLHSHGLFVRPTEMRIRGPRDLSGRPVGATRGGFSRRFVESEYKIPVVLFDTYGQGLRELASGGIDAFAGDIWVGAYTIQAENIRGVTVLEPFASQAASIALRKGNPELLRAINRSLAVLEQNGTLAQIQQRWRPKEMVFLSRDRVRSIVLGSVGAAVGLLLLLMGIWVWSLKRQIRVRRETELALRESNERLRTLSDNLPQGMIYQLAWERDGSRRFLHLSATVEKIHGVSVAEAMVDADLLYRQLVREDRGLLEETEARSARTGEMFHLEVRIKNRRDELRWVQLTAAPRSLADGRVVWDGIEFDITARKVTEQIALQSARELQMIFDHAPVGIALLKDRKFVRVNTEQASMLGYAPEEFVGMTARHVYPSDQDFEPISTEIYTALARDGYAIRETTFRCKNGSLVQLHLRIVPADPKDPAAGIVCLSVDLTEVKMAEQALRASEARLQEVFDHTTEVIFVVKVAADGAFSYERINRAAVAFGLNAGDFNAGTKTPRDIFPPESAASIEANYRKCIEARQPVLIEQELAMPTGVFYFAATLVPVFDAERATIVRIVGFSQDITARRNADAALRASEEKYRGIFESAIEGIFRSSPEGRYLSVNPSMARMIGYASPEEMIASVTDIATQIYHDPAERQRILARIEREGRLDNEEMQVRRKDGSLMWVLASLRAVRDAAGKVLHYDGTSIDITERKRLSALETSTLRAEAASRAKSSFLANMSHEIRTPMNAILGFSQLLMRDPDLSPAQREHLRVIDRNGEHLMALITDILEMSKIEANRATLNRSAFVVIGLARDLESMFRARIIAQGLAFILEIDESCGERLVGDVGKLRQIFVNLLANAIKFTSTGRITLRLRAEPLLDGNWCLRGEVEDTGPGIPPGFIGQLFDEFAQTDFGQRTGSGTGLGLPISRQFARMMEGDITVETREGHGSIFRVSVILTRGAIDGRADLSRRNGAAETFVQLAPGQPEQRILVVDDQADSRQFLRLLFVGAGFAVREAANGAEAVSAAENWRPHCILMDLRMPVMGGIEAITEIRRHEYGRAIRIISLTASVFVEDRARVLAAGADQFMTKPVHVAELFEQIAALNDVRYIRSGVGADEPAAQGVLISDAAMFRIPAILNAQLRRAVEAADLDLVLALTDELAALDEPAAGEIRRIANRFDYPALLAVLDAAEAKS